MRHTSSPFSILSAAVWLSKVCTQMSSRLTGSIPAPSIRLSSSRHTVLPLRSRKDKQLRRTPFCRFIPLYRALYDPRSFDPKFPTHYRPAVSSLQRFCSRGPFCRMAIGIILTSWRLGTLGRSSCCRSCSSTGIRRARPQSERTGQLFLACDRRIS